MSKTLTEQWREGKLPCGAYYVNRLNEIRIYLVTYEDDKNTHEIYEVIAPVPSYRALYGPNDGNMTTGVFTILEIIKRDIDNAQKQRSLTDLECGIKSQVVSLLKKWGVK